MNRMYRFGPDNIGLEFVVIARDAEEAAAFLEEECRSVLEVATREKMKNDLPPYAIYIREMAADEFLTITTDDNVRITKTVREWLAGTVVAPTVFCLNRKTKQ